MKFHFKGKLYNLAFRKKIIPWSFTRTISSMNNEPSQDRLTIKGSKLEGKVALVTGGSKGIGLAITKRLLQDGAKVIITGRNENQLSKTVRDLNSENIKSIVWDISNVKDNKKYFQMVNEMWGHVDILINNAGVTSDRKKRLSFEDMDNDHIRFVHNINVIGTTHLCSLFASNTTSGTILNIISNTAVIPARDAYYLSKWALYSYTKAFSEELKVNNITINGLCPGPIKTDMTFSEGSNLYRQNIPNHRIGLPEEIAELAYVQINAGLNGQTGEITICDGGESLN